MSHKQRNTLILAVQFIGVLLSGGYLLLQRFPAEFDSVQQEYERCNRILDDRSRKDERLARIGYELTHNTERMSSWTKVIDTSVTMTDVLAYLNDIQQVHGSVIFTLTYIREALDSTYGYKVFSFDGEGDWESVFSLIWALENGPRLFSIDRLNIRGVEVIEEMDHPPYYSQFRLVAPFSMEIKAFFSRASTSLPKRESAAQTLGLTPEGVNILTPSITRDLPPNDLGLLECERAALKALLPDKVIVADHLGAIHSLREGDEVYLGYLSKINRMENTIEFVLNKGGIIEKFILKFYPGPSSSERRG